MNESWGMEGLSSNDMVIPRINLMQSISKQVKAENAKAGDILSSTEALLAARGKHVQIIPILSFREWIINDVSEGKGKEKFLTRMPITADNERWPNEGEVNGIPITRTRNLNFFVILPGRLEELPFLISFRKSSYHAGKKLSTLIQIEGGKGKAIASKVYLLGSHLETRDKNDYYVFDICGDRETTAEELTAAKKWHGTIAHSRGAALLAAAPQPSLPPISVVSDEEVVPF